MVDFTLNTYEKLLHQIRKANYQSRTMQEFLQTPQNSDDKIIVLRHDVDRRPQNALRMAQLEEKLNFKSTYYFRHMPHTFKADKILEIASMNHEIGYHYETLAKARGNYEKAYQIFTDELEDFRNLYHVRTACMHGRPLSKWDNRDLWKQFDYHSLGIIGEPYLSINYQEVLYITDTGRRWDGQKYNLRDKVDSSNNQPLIKTTAELSTFLKNNSRPIILQTHPERWAYSLPNFLVSYGSDLAANAIKSILLRVRKS